VTVAVPFVDFKAHVRALRPEIDAAVARVLDSGWFMRKIVLGEDIQLFGGGGQKRDFDYVDDVVDAFLRAGAMDAADGQVFNLGSEEPVSLLELVKMMIDIAGQGSYSVAPFPPERARIDIGDFYADTTKIRTTLGWAPKVPLRDGLARSIEYYRAHKEHYL
jgi:UDP-glucose 4-epimerase